MSVKIVAATSPEELEGRVNFVLQSLRKDNLIDVKYQITDSKHGLYFSAMIISK